MSISSLKYTCYICFFYYVTTLCQKCKLDKFDRKEDNERHGKAAGRDSRGFFYDSVPTFSCRGWGKTQTFQSPYTIFCSRFGTGMFLKRNMLGRLKSEVQPMDYNFLQKIYFKCILANVQIYKSTKLSFYGNRISNFGWEVCCENHFASANCCET